MHIDHRGGFINTIAIDKEFVLAYSKRRDDLIHIHNLDDSYGVREFTISRELPQYRIDTVRDWLSWTQNETNKRKEIGTEADWVNKLKAVPVYLQTLYPDKKLSGFDAVMESNIPPGMGLSSSSAIVVAMMEIMIDINNISLNEDKFVNYCGISEWFVGTRGGSGDHAAIKFGRLGMITHMKTLPALFIKSYLPFPEGYKIVIFDSGIVADKSGGARQKFNEKTATYEIGEIYVRDYMNKHFEIKKFYLADVIEYLSQAQIYELLKSLPERIFRKELLKNFPQYEELLNQQFTTHLEPEDGYKIREALAYGISECERSRMLEDVLKKGDIELFGELMNISHDGDRIVFKSEDEKNKKRAIDTKKALYLNPGGYDCSIPEIDEMVDTAIKAGASGSQISGAGLGGSMMALVKDENFERLIEVMGTRYKYYVFYPVQGACKL